MIKTAPIEIFMEKIISGCTCMRLWDSFREIIIIILITTLRSADVGTFELGVIEF